MKKDEASKIINDTLNNFMDSAEDLEEFAKWLDRNSYRYSLRNAILIRSQNSGAICCQSVGAWVKANYRVRKEEFKTNGIVVFVPQTKTMVDVDGDGKCEKELKNLTKEEKKLYRKGEYKTKKKLNFGLGFTYDIAQTTVPVEEYNKFLSRGEKSVEHAKAWNALKKCVGEKYGIPVYDVDEKEINGVGLFGFCRHYPNGKQEIHLARNLKDTQMLSVGGHEIGHALLHKERGKSVDQMEVEADIFSILINTHYGVPIEDTRKRHLKEHFNNLKFKDVEDKNKRLASMVSDVLEMYKKYIVDVDSMIQ